MKTIGLIGGTTWLSTVEYYRIINQKVNEKLGDTNSARIVMYSVNFAEVNVYARTKNWKELASYLITISHKLQESGAECLLICANTPHIVADDIRKELKIPLIHIAEETAREISRRGIKTAGLLGTKFTMEENFYKEKLIQRRIDPSIPEQDDREFIHKSIFDELGKNIFKQETKQRYLNIIGSLVGKGAEGIILGCTEIPLLIRQEDCSVPVFDTTLIHASSAVEFALSN